MSLPPLINGHFQQKQESISVTPQQMAVIMAYDNCAAHLAFTAKQLKDGMSLTEEAVILSAMSLDLVKRLDDLKADWRRLVKPASVIIGH